MTYQRAIELLGLVPNFSDEELKKRYRLLARKYHPDNFTKASKKEQEDAEEKMKEINEAYSYFAKMKERTGNYHTGYDPLYIKEYRKLKISKLEGFIENSSWKEKEYPPYYRRYYDKVKSYVNIYKEEIEKAEELLVMDSLVEVACTQIKYEYEMFHNDFLLHEGISLEEDPGAYFYNCSMDQFYEQLISVKKARILALEDRIKREAIEYELWTSYPFLKSGIDQIVHNALNEVRKKINGNQTDFLEKMHKQIRELFDKHMRLLKRMDDLQNYFVNKYGLEEVMLVENDEDATPLDELSVRTNIEEEVIKILIDLWSCRKNYADVFSYDLTINRLNEIEENLNQYHNTKKISNKEENLRELFHVVNKKLSEVLEKYSTSDAKKAPYQALETMGCFLELYELMRRNELDEDDGLVLKELTFENMGADRKKLNDLISKINARNSLKAYIILGDNIRLGSYIFTTTSEDEIYVNLVYFADQEKRRMRIPKQLLENEYITLAELLENATFIGKRELDTNALVLYTWGNFVIRMQESGEITIDNTELKPSVYDFRTIPFKDKEYTKRMILKGIYEKIIIHNEMIKEETMEPAPSYGRVRTYMNKFNWLKDLMKK